MIIVVLITIIGFIPQTQEADTVLIEREHLTIPRDSLSVSAPPVTKAADPQQPGQGRGGEDEEELEVIPMWPHSDVPGFSFAETDSTLRWFMALDWTQRLAQTPGVIPYRTGSLGRPAGLDIYSFENRHQNLQMYDLSVNDPVTGQVNWSRVPIHKVRFIETADWGITHRSSIRLRDHYLTQPRTYLNFDESQENYRSLEFSYTHNVTPGTNVELSYWDRKDGMQYPRSNMEGSQVLARVRHHLTDEMLLKAGYISNSIDQEQPFGYNITNLESYLFNPFNAVPLQSSASSNQAMNDLYLQFHQRKDLESPAFRMAGIYHQKDKWRMSYSQDSTRYSMSETGVHGWQDIPVATGRIRATGRVGFLQDKEGESLTRDKWFSWSGMADAELPITGWADFQFHTGYQGRSDGRSGMDASGQLKFNPLSGFEIGTYAGYSSSIPDIQALYWESEEGAGDSNLGNETGLRTGLNSRLQLSSILTFGGRVEARQVWDGIFTDETGNFMNINSYTNWTSAAWLKLDSQHFEGELSVSTQSFYSDSKHKINQNLDLSGDKVWLKSSLYWKNYLFDQATYVKAGISGMFTPGNYLSADYVAPMNRWQHGTSTQYLPSFYRLDVNVSARVRWLMVLVRWENVFDRLEQAGYFETARYPMPPRRLLFGLRVLFTN